LLHANQGRITRSLRELATMNAPDKLDENIPG